MKVKIICRHPTLFVLLDTIRKALKGKQPISKKQISILKTNAKNIIQLDKIREKELKLLCPERRNKQDNS